MKNIHVLPTDKPSKIYIINAINKLDWSKEFLQQTLYDTNQNIYITSDEEIKEGDWYLNTLKDEVEKCEDIISQKNVNLSNWLKKIILTTDQDLIKYGVQTIDDEFLEWLVKNPSCEFVNIVPFDGYNAIKGSYFGYEIIIPKEEPKQHVELINDNIEEFDKSIELFKQETLKQSIKDKILSKISEEVKQRVRDTANKLVMKQETLEEYTEDYKPSFVDLADTLPEQETLEEAIKYYAHNNFNMHETNNYKALAKGFEAGVKWQQEKSYSDMQEYATFCIECDRKEMPLLLVQDWYEHYKN